MDIHDFITRRRYLHFMIVNKQLVVLLRVEFATIDIKNPHKRVNINKLFESESPPNICEPIEIQ